MTETQRQRVAQWMIPMASAMLGGGSVVAVNPLVSHVPYTDIAAERDQSQMREWVIKYVDHHVRPSEVLIRLDMLNDRINVLSDKIDTLDSRR